MSGSYLNYRNKSNKNAMLPPTYQMDIPALFLALSLFLFSSPISSANILHTLEEGSSLHVEKYNLDDVLISPNGVFSAGFYPVGENAFCFSIWFKKSKHKTVVWMANRDQPVNGRGSKLSLLKDGNLVLLDAGHINLWSTGTYSASPVRMELLDDGNLVLRKMENHSVLWESFASPTDTLLPGQKFTGELSLISSRSKTNFSTGFYKLYFDNDNVLRLLYGGPTISSVYWPDPWLLSWEAGRSTYNNSRTAVLDDNGQFLSSDDLRFQSGDSGAGVRRRLTVDYDGNIRLYSLNKSGDWVVSWLGIRQACRVHGICGPNSICTYDVWSSSSGRRCYCLPGYKMVTSTDWANGCELIQSNLSESDGDEPNFVQISRVEFYGYDFNYTKNVTLETCRKKCSSLSDCKGFQYKFETDNGNGVYLCFPKVELRNGHRSPSFNGDMYIKLPKSSLNSHNELVHDVELNCSGGIHMQTLNRTYEKHHENGSVKFLIWFACTVGIIEATFIFLVWCFLFKTRPGSGKDTTGYHLAATGFRKFTYTELKKATKGFKEEIGRGGAGIVYKGKLFDDRVAAIKRLDVANQGGNAEFLAEVGSIGRLNHMNLIDMWGYCAKGKHRLLVYEYMELGSLAENLSSKVVDWEKRFDIAVGTAKGLAYLHEECLEWVLHCDVKPQNILLDSNFQPKVADFGLSKLLNRGGVNNSSFSRMRGTRGYMAPEWVFNLPITSKVDVYSYGIVVLEMVTGKNPADIHAITSGAETEHISLVTWVREKMKILGVEEIMDPMLEGKHVFSKIELLVGVALQCVEEDKDARPTMSEVVEMLQRQSHGVD